MPAERAIELVEATLARHEGLAAAAFFGRTPEEHDRTRLPGFLKVMLQTDSAHEGAHTK